MKLMHIMPNSILPSPPDSLLKKNSAFHQPQAVFFKTITLKMVHICQTSNVMHNTNNYMFTGSHFKGCVCVFFFFYHGTTAIVGEGCIKLDTADCI